MIRRRMQGASSWSSGLALWCLALALSVGHAHAGEIVGVVVGVADGDTVKVLDGQKSLYTVRLAGIDAPEKAMPYGHRAKQHLSDLVFKKAVTVRAEKKDRYGRTVGKVLVDGRDANLSMVEAGLAWHYKRYSAEQSEHDRKRYADAEDEARRQRAGLWEQLNPTPPWEWRAARR